MSSSEFLENERIKHPEFIQAVISRIGDNSFVMRCWAVTATGVLLAVSIQTENWRVAAVILGIAASFWILDSSYLRKVEDVQAPL